MFGLGTGEIIIIAVVMIMLFGGKKLPGLGKSMGEAITNFKKGMNDSKKE
jgi:sec-independent protein translocase protein TatA